RPEPEALARIGAPRVDGEVDPAVERGAVDREEEGGVGGAAEPVRWGLAGDRDAVARERDAVEHDLLRAADEAVAGEGERLPTEGGLVGEGDLEARDAGIAGAAGGRLALGVEERDGRAVRE